MRMKRVESATVEVIYKEKFEYINVSRMLHSAHLQQHFVKDKNKAVLHYQFTTF